MRESRTEVAVGAAVLIAAAAFLAYGLQASGLRTGGGYDVTASFRSVEGVSPGTDVRMSGVSIGQVADVQLDLTNFRAVTRMVIRDGIPLPDDSSAVVASEGLLGGTFVEIVPGGSLDNLAPGAEIVDTQGAVSLLNLLTQFVAGGGSTETAAP
jgi:phospholipid/cholesterol/gamma-HCH transport system substrate-binding protein